MMLVALKILLALIGFGLGCGAVLWLRSDTAKQIKHLGLYLQIAVFLLAFAVVLDASFRNIGPDSRIDPLVLWVLGGGLIGVFGSGLAPLVRSWFR